MLRLIDRIANPDFSNFNSHPSMEHSVALPSEDDYGNVDVLIIIGTGSRS